MAFKRSVMVHIPCWDLAMLPAVTVDISELLLRGIAARAPYNLRFLDPPFLRAPLKPRVVL